MNRRLDKYDMLRRLWLTRIPNIVRAYHNNGRFDEIELHSVTEKFDEWEKANQQDMKKFAVLVKHIIKLAKARPDGRLAIRSRFDQEGSCLDVRTQVDGKVSALSDSVKTLWLGEPDKRGVALRCLPCTLIPCYAPRTQKWTAREMD